MGSATIKSHLGAGQYSIELVKSEAKALARKTAIEARQIVVDADIVTKGDELATALVTLNEKIAALEAAVAAMTTDQKTIDAVKTAQTEQITAEAAVTIKRREISLLKLEKISLAKELTQINTALAKETVNAWCADLSTSLTGTVGTIEVNGEADQILIMPGGAAGAGLLQHPLSMSPAGVFVNWAKLPAWQKWKPTYRVGTITALLSGDKCDVGIEAQYSEGLLINQAGALYEGMKATEQGWTDFAAHNPDFPLVTNTESTTLPATFDLAADLDSVNKSVNDGCKYEKDDAQYKSSEYWAVMQDGGSGDCEDFALTKAKKLLDMGYPASAIHLEVGVTETGVGHAWLVVQTDIGDYVLDNRYSKVIRDTNLPYSNRSRQTGMSWKCKGVKLSDVPVVYMTCHANAFLVGDEVIVKFENQNWSTPKVVGFASNPRGCGLTIHAVSELDGGPVNISGVSLHYYTDSPVQLNNYVEGVDYTVTISGSSALVLVLGSITSAIVKVIPSTTNHMTHYIVASNFSDYNTFIASGAIPISGSVTARIPYYKVDSITSSLNRVTPDDPFPMDYLNRQYFFGPLFRAWVEEKLSTADVIYHPTWNEGGETNIIISKRSLTQTATVSVTASASVTSLVGTSIFVDAVQLPQAFTYYYNLFPNYHTFADVDGYLLEDSNGDTYPDYWLRNPKLIYSISSSPAIDLSVLSNEWQPHGPSGPTVTNDWIESLSYGQYAATAQKEGTSASITFSYTSAPEETFSSWDPLTKDPSNPVTLAFIGAYIIVGCSASTGPMKYIKNTIST